MSTSFAQMDAIDGSYSYTNRWGMVSNRNLGGENFRLLPPGGGMSKMYEKFLRQSMILSIFPEAIGRNLKNLKQTWPISPLTTREKFSPKSSAVSEIGVIIWGHLT